MKTFAVKDFSSWIKIISIIVAGVIAFTNLKGNHHALASEVIKEQERQEIYKGYVNEKIDAILGEVSDIKTSQERTETDIEWLKKQAE